MSSSQRIPTILYDVAHKYGVGILDITSAPRNHSMRAAKDEAAYRIRTEVGLSYPSIARELGVDRDAVALGVQRHEERLRAG